MYQLLIVALLSSFEIYVAIGTGLAFGLTTHQICLATLAGGISGIYISVFLGERISNFIAKFRKPKPKKETTASRILNSLWAKYGKFGVGFIGTLLVGAPLSIAVGVGFGVQVRQMITYCLIAVIIRCIAFSYFFGYIKELF